MRTTLLQLQNEFQQQLMQDASSIFHHIVDDKVLSASSRMAIYQDAYILRLMEVLYADYPILSQRLGEAFEPLAKAYIKAFPSTYRSVRWFGQHFSDFLKISGYTEDSWQSELARFEWSLMGSFDVEDKQALNEASLMTIAPEDWVKLVFTFHPSFQIMTCAYNTVSLWKAARQGKNIKPKKYKRPVAWMIWRQGLTPYFIRLKNDELCALMLAKEGKSFGDICENLSRFVPMRHLVSYCASLLKQWLQRDLIIGVDVNAE